MLRHAEKVGAKVVEQTKVTEIEWVGEGEAARPVAAHWKNKAGETGKITFDFVIDASGRAGIISTKYLKNRDFNSYLKNVAIWGYWKGAGKYLPGTPRENSPLFEALAGMIFYHIHEQPFDLSFQTKLDGIGSSLSTMAPFPSASWPIKKSPLPREQRLRRAVEIRP